jgi:NADP-dependent 3-hydroxy acid dehydrogenase YdfG
MHIFITGGTKGIGKGLVNEFLKNGHKVSYTGTSDKSIAASVIDLDGDFKAYVCDVRQRESIVEAMNQAIKEFGNIDIWINNAGVSHPTLPVSKLSEEEIKKVIEVNVLGTIYGTSIALEQMKKQKYGAVYNFEGLGSNGMVIPKTVVYGSSKRLITYFCKGCNKELKEFDNIFVGTIQPGMVFTALLLDNMPEENMKIAKILGSEVSYVTPKIVSGILKGKRKIKILTNFQITWRFLSRGFKKYN